MLKFKKYLLPCVAMVVIGMFAQSCVEGDTYIRYTWDSREARAGGIDFIAASEKDVDWYLDLPYTPGQMYVLNGGSRDVPNNIYSNTLRNYSAHNGKYYRLKSGKYTAICALLDSDGDPWVDIIANYSIYGELGEAYSDVEDTYFELAFDVYQKISMNEVSWYLYDNGRRKGSPRFSKALEELESSPITFSEEITKGGRTIKVDYVIVPRKTVKTAAE
jgi:hypothetical protein